MTETLKLDTLPLLLVFVIPGLISMQVYRMLMPARALDWQSSLFQGMFYGAINFAICVPIIMALRIANAPAEDPVLFVVGIFVVFALAPIAWPIIYTWIVRSKWYLSRFQVVHPTAWDWYFDRRETAFILVHLNDGTKIGGYYGPKSYAGSCPSDGDLYLEKVLITNPDTGTFNGYVDRTNGLIIRRDQYRFVELFDVRSSQPVDQKGNGNAGRQVERL